MLLHNPISFCAFNIDVNQEILFEYHYQRYVFISYDPSKWGVKLIYDWISLQPNVHIQIIFDWWYDSVNMIMYTYVTYSYKITSSWNKLCSLGCILIVNMPATIFSLHFDLAQWPRSDTNPVKWKAFVLHLAGMNMGLNLSLKKVNKILFVLS